MSLPAHSQLMKVHRLMILTSSQWLTVQLMTAVFLENTAIRNLLTGIQSILLLEDKATDKLVIIKSQIHMSYSLVC